MKLIKLIVLFVLCFYLQRVHAVEYSSEVCQEAVNEVRDVLSTNPMFWYADGQAGLNNECVVNVAVYDRARYFEFSQMWFEKKGLGSYVTVSNQGVQELVPIWFSAALTMYPPVYGEDDTPTPEECEKAKNIVSSVSKSIQSVAVQIIPDHKNCFIRVEFMNQKALLEFYRWENPHVYSDPAIDVVEFLRPDRTIAQIPLWLLAPAQ